MNNTFQGLLWSTKGVESVDLMKYSVAYSDSTEVKVFGLNSFLTLGKKK